MSDHNPLSHRIVLIDIDGLRADVFDRALQTGSLPNLARLLGGPAIDKGIQFQPIYCCQASSFTGAHPCQHWIPGNHFFDRFGRINQGVPRKYEFDFIDAPAVFLTGLAGNAIHPDVQTLYETATEQGLTSTVAYNMYAHGAQHWLKPGLDDWRDFAAGARHGFGERYDNAMVGDVCEHLRAGHRPDILTLYFFGLDHDTHLKGPHIQAEYLSEVVDRQIGRFLKEYEAHELMDGSLFVVFSDHGQKEVVPDDEHSLKVGFIFDRELGYVFEALGLDVFDHPLEGPHCEALLSPAGGMAQVYLRRKGGAWKDEPHFAAEVLPLAKAFWDSNAHGKYCRELQGTLSMVMVRNVEQQGWFAEYQVYTPQGLFPVSEYLGLHPEVEMVDAANRIHYMTSPVTGDLLLFAHYDQGYSFSQLPYRGMHGGLHPDDSRAVLTYSLPGGTAEQITHLRQILSAAITQRCQTEGGRQVGNVDMAYGLRTLMGWE
jgi:hypothetical protein